MLTHRQLFFSHLAQTSDFPIALEIVKAEGIYLTDVFGKKYMDLISGISVSNVGHRHPKVLKAISEQLDNYMHLMVYGEYIQSPQVQLAKLLSDNLPENLSSVYFVNSGSEANEGALKLAKRWTGRTELISFTNAYHGSSHGALSVMGNENFKNAFRPLLPDVRFINFNNVDDLKNISEKTACVIVEPIQGEAGVVLPKEFTIYNSQFTIYLKLLRERCDEVGALLIFDEVQTGFGRTGKLFAFEHYQAVPDILTIAKGMGGGMPIGAFVSSNKIMNCLTNNPVLGHITTFGGHPVCCAASKACLEILLEENLIEQVRTKELLFRKLLQHPSIKEIRGKGLLLAVEFEDENFCIDVINKCIENGVIVDWFLFDSKSMRIAPPLTITEEEIKLSCEIIVKQMDNLCY